MSAQEKARLLEAGLNKNINFSNRNYSTKNASNFVQNSAEKHENNTGGFVPSVLSRLDAEKRNYSAVNSDFATSENVRLFLISNKRNNEKNSNKKIGKKKKVATKNGKYVTYSGVIKSGETEYKINCGKNSKRFGVYSKIIKKSIEQLDICIEKYKRVLVVMFNLHQKYRTKDNKHISRFRKNLNRRLEREYNINDVGYVWVREQERAKSQHYHFSIFLDGNKVRHSSRVLKIIESTWKAINPTNHVPVIKNPYYFISGSNKDEVKADAVYRMSYLAKVRGKGYRNKQVKDYSTSRLVAPFKGGKMEIKL